MIIPGQDRGHSAGTFKSFCPQETFQRTSIHVPHLLTTADLNEALTKKSILFHIVNIVGIYSTMHIDAGENIVKQLSSYLFLAVFFSLLKEILNIFIY